MYSGSPRYDGEAAAARTLRHTARLVLPFPPQSSLQSVRKMSGAGARVYVYAAASQAGGPRGSLPPWLALHMESGGGSPTPRLPTPVPNTQRERDIGRSVGCLGVFMTRKKKLLVSGCVYPDPEHMHTRPGETAHHTRAREPHAYVPSSPRRHANPSSQRADATGAVPCQQHLPFNAHPWRVQVPCGGGGCQLCLPYLCRARARGVVCVVRPDRKS